MTEFGKMMLALLTALTTESMLFSRGIGFSRVLKAARKGWAIGLYAGLICIFSLLSALFAPMVAGWLPAFWFPLSVAVLAAAWYLAACLILAFAVPKVYRKISEYLPSAAINSVVLSIPFLGGMAQWSVGECIGFALGTGISFWIVGWLLVEMMPRLTHISVPRAFRGTPAVFLYLAILALAFLGFAKV